MVGDNEPTEISMARFQNFSDNKKNFINWGNTFSDFALKTRECADATASNLLTATLFKYAFLFAKIKSSLYIFNLSPISEDVAPKRFIWSEPLSMCSNPI